MGGVGARILVCGGRFFAKEKALYRVLDALPAPSLVITGGASGADTLADLWAESRGFPRAVFPANWRGEGKAAGFTRNIRMLDIAQPNVVIAFPGDEGTKHMMDLGRQMPGVEVRDIEAEWMLD